VKHAERRGRYTPEEGQEILRIAMQQRKDTFSVQEIESIGREVGIEPDPVHTAIERYRQIREEEQRLLEQERIAQEQNRVFWQHAGNQLLPEPVIIPLPQPSQEEMHRLQQGALRRQFENATPGR
jgi:DNA-binding transcriptional MerR regulator